MNQFDHYIPAPSLSCPACGAGLDHWQGSDGPNAGFVWQQGVRQPVDPRPAGAGNGSESAAHLPVAFRIHTYCCSKQFPVEAICRAPNGTWISTELITAGNAQRHKDERMEDFKARLRWLQRGKR